MTTRKSSSPTTRPARAASLPVRPEGVSVQKTPRRPANKPVPQSALAPSAPSPAQAGGAPASSSAKKSKETGRVAKQRETRVSLEFRLPKEERDALKALKQRVRKMEPSVKKSVLLRAAIKTLMTMPDSELLAAIKVVKFD